MKKSYQHTIDFLFPIALFFVFSATALFLLLTASNVYQEIVSASASEFEQNTALSYITGKIRQHDAGGTENIYLTVFDGHDALAIEQDYENSSFITYIYEAEGELKEIFLQKGAKATADSGTAILEINTLEMKEISQGLFKFVCTSSDGTYNSVIVSLSSEDI